MSGRIAIWLQISLRCRSSSTTGKQTSTARCIPSAIRISAGSLPLFATEAYEFGRTSSGLHVSISKVTEPPSLAMRGSELY